MTVGYVYSLGQKCVAEGFGMMMVRNNVCDMRQPTEHLLQIIYLGEGVLANELLAKTHGHEVGWMWVAFGFGMVCL